MHGKDCVLYDRACVECGECDRCDLDPEKTCDNCMACVKGESDYLAVRIDGVLTPEETLEGEETPEA
ncbi:hypothetical protein LJC74_04825 [Eubacteriales bacterium OttesenSCG-928-A19]|nr:hypothetical protein [Eubacteriales bacterium OttesenSCG-928-A19]